MPIKVYLDNQDFSRLYRPPNEALAAIAKDLFDLRDNGIAAFYYSYWHIFEFLQPAQQKYLKDRRERAAFLKRLCGNNSLPYFTDVLSGVAARPGIWVPSEVILTVTDRLNDRLNDAIIDRSKDMSRAFRRKAKSPGFQRKAFEATFSGNLWERKMQLQEGFTDEFVEAAPVSRLFRGKITDAQFREYLVQMFCDPEYFFEQWFVKDGRENPIKQQINEIGDKWIDRLRAMRDNARDYDLARAAAVQNKRKFYDGLRTADLPNDLKRDLAERFPPTPPRLDINTILDDVSPDTRLRYLSCYLQYHMNFDITKKNDIADLMHLFYTHDVDLMRCDRAIYSIMSRCKHLDQSKIVPSLVALPQRIREMERAPAGRAS